MTIAYCVFLICTSTAQCTQKQGEFNASQYADIVFNNLEVGNWVRAECDPIKQPKDPK